MDPQRFDELVSDALDLIPPELADAMDNVVVLVANRHPQHENLLGQLRRGRVNRARLRLRRIAA